MKLLLRGKQVLYETMNIEIVARIFRFLFTIMRRPRPSILNVARAELKDEERGGNFDGEGRDGRCLRCDFPKPTFAEFQRSRITLELLSRKAERVSLSLCPGADRADRHHFRFCRQKRRSVAFPAAKERKKWIVGKSNKMQFCLLPSFPEERSAPDE